MKTMNEIPNCPIVEHCHCFPEQEIEARKRGETHCVCGESEKALRGWIAGRIKDPMTQAQREWCLDEIDSIEGFNRNDYIGETDSELAMAVLEAWQA